MCRFKKICHIVSRQLDILLVLLDLEWKADPKVQRTASLRFAGRYPTKATSHGGETAADPIQGGVVAGASISLDFNVSCESTLFPEGNGQ